MKQVLNVGIGGRSFVIDEDAFDRLSAYLDAFRSRTGLGYQTKEVMDDLEMRIAEIFSESLSSRQEVVDISLVERVIAQLGMPDGSTAPGSTGPAGTATRTTTSWAESPPAWPATSTLTCWLSAFYSSASSYSALSGAGSTSSSG